MAEHTTLAIPEMPVRPRTAWRAMAGGVLAACAMLVGGCSGLVGDASDPGSPYDKTKYKSSKSVAPLEVPPDLVGTRMREALEIPGVAATYSQYAGGEEGTGSQSPSSVLPKVEGARIERSGALRWLVVQVEPEDLWPGLRDFWTAQGFVLETENPEVGVMETDWAEKQTTLPAGAIKRFLNLLSDRLYGVAFRDQYRTRIERGAEPGSTDVYITHRGAEQTVVGKKGPEEIGERVWRPLPGDPGLEAEMLTRLMLFLGLDKERADALIAGSAAPGTDARIVREDGGASALVLDEGFGPAWRRVGVALDRAGFNVEDRDRSRGLYFVRYLERDGGSKGGFLSSLIFWGDDSDEGEDAYLIRVTNEGPATTRIVVLDGEGERDASEGANRIIEVLHGQLG